MKSDLLHLRTRRTPRPACQARKLALAAALAVLAAGQAAHARPAEAAEAPAEQAQRVGEVSLLIGQAQLFRANGQPQALQRGDAIHVGDRIETQANGHVHVRFVDRAAVSVRPSSTLEVQSYQFDPRRPELNEVRLRVDRGTSRSISGAATELDKSRFRLNTPIAAIGVRGTDFTVQASEGTVRATVADGAIAIGALGVGGCTASGLGPCADAQELSADMGRLMAELRLNEQGPRLVPAVDLSVADAGSRRAASSSSETQTMAEVRSLGLAAAEPTNVELQRGNDKTAAELLTVASVRVPDLNRPSDLANQLIWGRYAIIAEPGERLSVPFVLARLGRHVTVGDYEMALFRADQSTPGEFFSASRTGTAEFGLSRASVSFEGAEGVQAAGISAGSLRIDFTNRTFATALNLFAAGGETGELRVAGGIRPDGIFTVRDAEQYVSGAISLDAREAGYLFERTTGSGLFRGRTLWGP